MTFALILLILLAVILGGALAWTLLKQKSGPSNEEFLKSINPALEKLVNATFVESLKTLGSQNEAFVGQSKDGMTSVLAPFEQQLKALGQNTADLFKQNAALKERLQISTETQGELRKVTEILSQSLSGNVKTQGCWGERVLSHVLESSGLRKAEEFELEFSITVGSSKYRPDAVVFLPEKKALIIDAKTSLKSYQDYTASTTEEGRDLAQKDLVDSIEKHIKGLSEKEYFKANEVQSLDFVFMFIPIEGALSLALEKKSTLIDLAWDKKIVLTTPLSLMSSLKTVSFLWRQEHYNKNAEQIAEKAGALYDKFATLSEDFIKMGDQLETVQKTHSAIQGRLSTGRGNIVSQLEGLQELGAKNSKSIAGELKQ